MPDFRLTAIAQSDVLEIVGYGVEEFGYTVSEAYLRGLYDLFAHLAQQPMIGRTLTAATPSTRRHPYRRHVVVNEVAGDGILILGVVPMARMRDPDQLPD